MIDIDSKVLGKVQYIIEMYYDEAIKNVANCRRYDTLTIGPNYTTLLFIAGAASYAASYLDFPAEIIPVIKKEIGDSFDDLDEDELPKALARILEDNADAHFRCDRGCQDDFYERAEAAVEEVIDSEYLKNIVADIHGDSASDLSAS